MLKHSQPIKSEMASVSGHGAMYWPEIWIGKKTEFGIWLSAARAVPACSGFIRTKRTSEIIIFSFLFQTLHACWRQCQTFRLKLRLCRLLDPRCFTWKAWGERRGSWNICSHLHKRRYDYLTASSSLFMRQTSQTSPLPASPLYLAQIPFGTLRWMCLIHLGLGTAEETEFRLSLVEKHQG